jgi:hypothetical protein
MNSEHSDSPGDERVIADTRRWLERAVIGLNLCPFAKAEYVNRRIRFVVSPARSVDELLDELQHELLALEDADPLGIETTLLMHPHVLGEFLDYNDFLDDADALLQRLDLDGILQIASFHPQYLFAGEAPDDISHFSNRSPWPTLHLLRETSIERAVQAFPEASQIYERNMRTLQALGLEGWRKLMRD